MSERIRALLGIYAILAGASFAIIYIEPTWGDILVMNGAALALWIVGFEQGIRMMRRVWKLP